MHKNITITNFSFTYQNSIEPIFDNLSIQLETGWTGVVGANGSGKTTLLKLLCGILAYDKGHLGISGSVYYCEQRTDHMPDSFPDFLKSVTKQTYRLKETLQVQEEWQYRWPSLSHGERKRAQIATALYHNAYLLAIDEPSNHLDQHSKQILFNALKSHRGIGLLVSHDRQLLDNLCKHTLFIIPPKIEIRKNGYGLAVRELEREAQHRLHTYTISKQEVKKLKRKVAQQREKANNADKRRSKGKLNTKDHDARSKKDLAKLTGRDKVDGRLHHRLKSQLKRAEDRHDRLDFKKNSPLGISFNKEISRIKFPLIIHKNTLPLGSVKKLTFPELTINSDDCIGIIGFNGSGKSTFLEYLINYLAFNPDQILYIPQEIPAKAAEVLINRLHGYPDELKGRLMNMVSRLGSDPVYLLQTTLPTPGEVRKLLLAEGLMKQAGIIIMDEPTNHMDLPSMECIETALKECRCTQLLVSHDLVFLEKIVSHYWHFKEAEKNLFSIEVVPSKAAS